MIGITYSTGLKVQTSSSLICYIMVVKYCVLHIYIRQKQNTVNQTVRNIMKIVIFLYSFLKKCTYKLQEQDFPCGPVVENPSASEEDMGLIFGLGGFYMLQGN